jgi:hypothetical protein
MTTRGINAEEVAAAVADPTQTDQQSNGVRYWGRNGVTVVLDATLTTVITVYERDSRPKRWRGRNEGVAGWRRDPVARRNRSPRRRSVLELTLFEADGSRRPRSGGSVADPPDRQ